MDEAQLRQLKQRVDEELRQREVAFLEFWLGEVKAIEARHHKELAGLQSDLKALSKRMETRLRILKGGPR